MVQRFTPFSGNLFLFFSTWSASWANPRCLCVYLRFVCTGFFYRMPRMLNMEFRLNQMIFQNERTVSLETFSWLILKLTHSREFYRSTSKEIFEYRAQYWSEEVQLGTRSFRQVKCDGPEGVRLRRLNKWCVMKIALYAKNQGTQWQNTI